MFCHVVELLIPGATAESFYAFMANPSDGLYHKWLPDEHWAVDRSLSLPMEMWINYEGKTIASYYPSELQWWITSFNPDYKNVKAEDLTAMFTVNFSDNRDMYDAFQKEWDFDGSPWTFYDKTYTARLKL